LRSGYYTSRSCKRPAQALALKDVSLGWEAVISPLDESLDALSRCWGGRWSLNAVMDEAAWRKAFNKMLPLVTDFYTMLEQDQTLLAACQKLQQQLPKGNLADLNLQRSRVSNSPFKIFDLQALNFLRRASATRATSLSN
jgi:Zn-dependent oligopeptidase